MSNIDPPPLVESASDAPGHRQPGVGAERVDGRLRTLIRWPGTTVLKSGGLAGLMRRFGLLVAWLGLIIFYSIAEPITFPTLANVQIIAGSQAVLLVLTMGPLIPLVAGEFDLSIAGTMGVSLVLVGWLNVINHWPIGLAIAAALATGVTVGVINGFVVVVIGVDSIVMTLGMGTLLLGASAAINIESTGGISPLLVGAIHQPIFGIPAAFYYAVALTALVWYVFTYTPLGRYLYFVGAGREVARLAGIPVDTIRFGSLVAGATLSALAGIVLAGWLGASDPNISANYLLPTFAAIFLGATTIQPGRFNAWGTLAAAYFLVTGITGLELLGYSGWIEQVFYGASLIFAVAIARLGTRGELA